MAVANRMEEVAAREMTVTGMTTTTIATTTATTTTTTTATPEMDEEKTKEGATEEGAATTTTEDAAEGESSFGGGASGRQIWDESRMFDPGFFGHISKFDGYKFQNLGGKRARCYMV